MINFEFVITVADGAIQLFLLVIFIVLSRSIKEVVPVEVLIVFGYKIVEVNRLVLGNAQLQTKKTDQLSSRYFLACQKVPNKRYLCYYDLYVAVADLSRVRPVQVTKTEFYFFLERSLR